MAIANREDSVPGWKLNSIIYKWSRHRFEVFQMFPTNGGSGFKFFTIDEDHYLAVAEFHDRSTYSVDSSLYKWKRGRFEKYQNFPTHGGVACDSIVIANDTYLVFANQRSPQGNHDAKSTVYKWSGGHFLKFQTMKARGSFLVPSSFKLVTMSFSDSQVLAAQNHLSLNGMAQNLPCFKIFQLVLPWSYACLK